MRNKRHHYLESAADVQALLGGIPEGFVSYWCSRFPELLMQVYALVRDSSVKHEALFRRYFKPLAP